MHGEFAMSAMDLTRIVLEKNRLLLSSRQIRRQEQAQNPDEIEMFCRPFKQPLSNAQFARTLITRLLHFNFPDQELIVCWAFLRIYFNK